MTAGLTLDELISRLLAVGAQMELRHGIPPERVGVALGGPCPPEAGCASCGQPQAAVCVYAPLLDEGALDDEVPVVEIRAAS